MAEERSLVETTLIASFLDKLENVLMLNREDNTLFEENLGLLMDEFKCFIYPLIIPCPDSVFNYLCSIFSTLCDVNSRKTFFELKNVKIPPTPSFKGKRDLCLDFKNSDEFLKQLQMPEVFIHQNFFVTDTCYKEFLNENQRYKKFIAELNVYNMKKHYRSRRKNSELKTLKTIKKNVLRKNKKNLTDFVVTNKFDLALEKPTLPPFQPISTQPASVKNTEVSTTNNEIDPQPSTSANFVSSVITDFDSSSESTEILNFDEVKDSKNTPLAIPNFDTPPLSPLLALIPNEMREEDVSSILNTPHPVFKRYFLRALSQKKLDEIVFLSLFFSWQKIREETLF